MPGEATLILPDWFGVGDDSACLAEIGCTTTTLDVTCACGWRDVADKVETKLVVQVALLALLYGHEQRVAVCGRAHDVSVAIFAPAPGRFSTTNAWLRRSESH